MLRFLRYAIAVGMVPMFWGKEIGASRLFVRLGVVLVLGALTSACFTPLYGDRTVAPGGDTVRDKLGAVQIAAIESSSGPSSPDARIAIALRNELMYEFNGNAAPISPTHRLQVEIQSTTTTTVIVDVSSGRAETQVEAVNAVLTLTEIATQKVVLRTTTFARASFDTPGSAQRFAQTRAWRNAQDRAVQVLADNIKNRLASFFVAGT
ncbi:MAG: hypothetical protein WB562_16140 [Candidatus Sulfotelmatobacter sp.]